MDWDICPTCGLRASSLIQHNCIYVLQQRVVDLEKELQLANIKEAQQVAETVLAEKQRDRLEAKLEMRESVADQLAADRDAAIEQRDRLARIAQHVANGNFNQGWLIREAREALASLDENPAVSD